MERSWHAVPIIACDEPVEIVYGLRIVARSEYYRRGYLAALPDVWVRMHVLERLREAARMLPGDLQLLAMDGLRFEALQRELFNEYRDSIAGARGLTGEALELETIKFVTAPEIDESKPFPHGTGGSIDLTLADKDGNPLDMGGEYDELSERSCTSFYERPEEELTNETRTFRDRRRLLCAVMTHVGFSNYREEWWHFDMGNQFHHERVGGTARYGAVKSTAGTQRVNFF